MALLLYAVTAALLLWLSHRFVPRSVRLGHDALQEMAHETDFASRAWIESAAPPRELANGPGTVITRNANLGYELDVTMENDGFVIASLPLWKGWRAYVDGRRVETHFANHAFIGVHVPRGRHRVRLRYLPDSFVAGACISFLTLIGAGLGALLVARRR